MTKATSVGQSAAEQSGPGPLLAQAADILGAVLGEVRLELYLRSGTESWVRTGGAPDLPATLSGPLLGGLPLGGLPLGNEPQLTGNLARMQITAEHLLAAAAPQWNAAGLKLLEAVGRQLAHTLALSEQLAQLEAGRGELEARTRALEAFAALTRELTLQADEVTLIRRAQDVALSLLPSGTALYYRQVGERWRLISQAGGSLRTPELQAVIDAGLPYATTHNLRVPWESGLPYYQDEYDHATDNLADLTHQIGATACLPVFMAAEPVGIFAVALAEARRWTAADRATLEAVTRSLSLAQEGARSVLALRDRSLELERSNRELEQFAYVASHDLQEPLRTVTSFAQLLVNRYRGQLDPKADLYLNMISDGTGRMSRLLQDLLAFSRVATSVQPSGPVELSTLLAEVCQDLQDQIERTSAQISVGELGHVLGETSQLRQVFQNLIGNALKFCVPGQTVRIRIEATTDEHVSGMVRFSVSDNGIGIAPTFHARIFTIFQRLHSREQYEGSGMGLAIARKIVERHGGELWVESDTGQGSTFFLTLPLAQVT